MQSSEALTVDTTASAGYLNHLQYSTKAEHFDDPEDYFQCCHDTDKLCRQYLLAEDTKAMHQFENGETLYAAKDPCGHQVYFISITYRAGRVEYDFLIAKAPHKSISAAVQQAILRGHASS